MPQCDMHLDRSRRHIGGLPDSILLLLLLLATTSTLPVTSLAILATIFISHDQIIAFASHLSSCRATSLSLSLAIVLVPYPMTTLSPRGH